MRRLAAVLLAALAVAPSALAAQKQAVFGLRAVGNNTRGYFVYTLTPGAVRQGSVIVSNVGNAPGTVKLFVADGTTGPTSGTVYKTDSKPSATGRWVSLSTTSFALKPGAHRSVSFTVHVPSNAKAGQWVAGIVAETSHQAATQKPGQKTRVQIRIRDLTIVAVQVNVPGPPVVSFAIGKVSTGGTRGFQKIIVHFANTGNVLVKPKGAITVFDKSGNVVETLPFEMDTFLPDTEIDYPVLLKKALAAGDYTATVRLEVPGVAGAAGKTFTAKPAFSVSNEDVKQVFTSAAPQAAPPASTSTSSSSLPGWALPAAAVAVALLVVAGLLWWLLGRRRRRDRRPPTTYARSPSALAVEAPVPDPTPTEPAPAAPIEPTPAAPAQPPPPPPPSRPADHEHYWEVAYDRGILGEDGVWRFPHRCRECGVELLARDIGDASARATQL